MEIPNKIYLEVLSHSEHKEVCKDVIKLKRTLEDDIEYVSTDAFIEKAYEWFEKNWSCYINTYPSSLAFDTFKNYMKGE